MNRLFFVLVLFVFQAARAIVCPPDHCASVQCAKVENCDGPNQVIQPGGFCNCCNVCVTILGENENCVSLSSIVIGRPPPTVQCGQGLICHKGTCKGFKSLSEASGTILKKQE